ncbi:hypothetical protein [Natrinema soli]|uniref:Uncharacterized protein n=1 Tax=Natrinema soli TaxID=1930624 RepID=A0ABD5ST08_9EURY|nr:hypothetical protein [Natrinema soli]
MTAAVSASASDQPEPLSAGVDPLERFFPSHEARESGACGAVG